MGGQRHSKNAGTMGVEGLTYHEKKALGFGTVKQRLGKVWLACLISSVRRSAAQVMCADLATFLVTS